MIRHQVTIDNVQVLFRHIVTIVILFLCSNPGILELQKNRQKCSFLSFR